MTKDIDLMTDDEAMREAGMTDGAKAISRFTLRPITAVSLSWMLRNNVLDIESGDTLQRKAAQAFLHTASKDLIRAVVNNRDTFLEAVDQWMDENVTHHSELEPVAKEMDAELDRYLSATTRALNPSHAMGITAKN